MLRSGATSFYNADGLGSVTSLSNGAGALAQTYTFDSFGKQTSSSGSLTNPFQYTGREFDSETSLYYYRARYYDPVSGRFLGEDPIAFGAGTNFYSYVSNNPIRLTDPLGLSDRDVQRILAACKKCTEKLTAAGERFNSTGALGGFLNNLISSVTLGHIWSGCDRQANLAAGCLDSPSPHYDDHWDFSVVSAHWGFHRRTMGIPQNPTDAIVICDPWLNRSWTVPRGGGTGAGGGRGKPF